MAMFRRIAIFLAVNFLVVITITTLLNVLGVQPYLNQYGMDYQSLLIFCVVWGMGGSFISLLLSKPIAKWTMGVKVVDPNTSDYNLSEYASMVRRLSQQAGLPNMPEIGIYDSPEINAFATGATKSRALVAVSTGLLSRMNSSEVEGVVAHELSHVANGDMVTMTLVQGVVNAFVMFLSRAVAFAIMNMGRSRDDERRGEGMSRVTYYIVQMILEFVFMFLGSMVVAWVSRQREYRADAGGARLAGRDKMVGALRALQRTYEIVDPGQPASVSTLKISSHPQGIWRLFSTHPALSERIERLEMAGMRE